MRPVELSLGAVQVGASIGVACFPQDTEANAEQLLKRADQAMYAAKSFRQQ